ncbi:hypothetical protein ACLOJK_015083 [Asimina triloba]
MPSYAKFMKEILSKKRKLVDSTTEESCSQIYDQSTHANPVKDKQKFKYTISHGPPEHRNSVLHHLPKELPWRLTSFPSGSRSAADVRPPAASNDPASTHHAQILATNAQTQSDGTRAGDATIIRTNPLNLVSAQPMQWLDPADASSGGLQ